MLHKSVLEQEVLLYLDCRADKNFIDATVGSGGHSKIILEKTMPSGVVVGFEQDTVVSEEALKRLEGFNGRFKLIEENFRFIDKALSDVDFKKFDGVLYDLGVSSIQLDTPGRGFSFLKDGPLDMRMSSRSSLNAEALVNDFSENEISKILRDLGEERFAKRIARNICLERKKNRIVSTLTLAQIIERSIPKKFQRKGIHPATKSFMALRIYVNDELNSLEESLEKAIETVDKGGRMVAISFHSLEDRIVKNFFKKQSNPCTCPRDLPMCICGVKPRLKIITKKPVLPTDEEKATNPRARSAKLRAAEVV